MEDPQFCEVCSSILTFGVCLNCEDEKDHEEMLQFKKSEEDDTD